MATENSSFLPRKNKSLFLLLFVLTACQMGPKQTPVGRTDFPQGQTAPQPGVMSPKDDEAAPAPLPVGVAPKIGLILGPGALRAYAHVGIVQEFAKQKMPIFAVAGVEMGALVAAIYANKGQPYDVEWQMMKLKESDLVQKGLLSSQIKAGDVRSLNEFMNMALSSSRAESAKVQFSCPAYQMEKQQVFIMSRGAYTEMLPYCMAFPPLFRPHKQNVSAIFSLKAIIDHMRAKGATYLVYVDLLSGPVKLTGSTPEAEVLWSLAGEASSQWEKGLDHVIHVPLRDFDLLDFNRRREMIQKGQQAAHEATSKIMKNINW